MIELENIDDILAEKLSDAFQNRTGQLDAAKTAKIVSEHEAVDLAYAVSRLPPHLRPTLFENLSSLKDKIRFLINTDSATRVILLRRISDKEAKEIFEKMPSDDAVEVMEDMSERRFRRVMQQLPMKRARQIAEILKHQRNTAGRLMTNDYFAFAMETTVGEASDAIRNNPSVDPSHGIFVLDEKGELQGYVPVRNFMINAADVPLKQVMRPIMHKVDVDTPREEVIDMVERYKIPALPVLNIHGKLTGVVAYEDVIEAVEDMADETISKFAGTEERVGEKQPLLKRFLHRAPWLLVTLLAGLINGGIMSSFDAKGIFTFVLFFVPLITGMSGNIGIQSSTVLVRSMATGAITSSNRRHAILKELAMGLFAGASFGLLTGTILTLFDLSGFPAISISPLALGTMISIGLFGACLAGTLLGVLSPLLFSRIGIDPAVASGPVITALNDFLSMTIYFLIAMGIGNLLV